MLSLKTINDLQRLVDEGLPESLTLDYKVSAALAKDNKARDEVCKDVSAFANSAGGQIIYGIQEKQQKPVRVDDGVDTTLITREWIEQVISSRVQPRIDGLIISPIPFAHDRAGYVITIPQATSAAPHQAPDNKYYKRFNFQSVPMADYEIRDAMHRSTTPDLFMNISFEGGGTSADVVAVEEGGNSKPVGLLLNIGNRSPQPAFYSVIQIFFDAELIVQENGRALDRFAFTTDQGHKLVAYARKCSIPHTFPIFKEMEFILDTRFLVVVPAKYMRAGARFLIGYQIISPGFRIQRFGELVLLQNRMTLFRP